MNIKRLAEATNILAKYAGDNAFCVAAEHDELWLGDDGWPLTDAEKARMNELGFTSQEGMGWHCFT